MLKMAKNTPGSSKKNSPSTATRKKYCGITKKKIPQYSMRKKIASPKKSHIFPQQGDKIAENHQKKYHGRNLKKKTFRPPQ